MKTSSIRQAFLNYFKNQGHAIIPSSPLIPRNDPTLMFTNAGMVQFKNYFTGAENPPTPRAATSQKCVRAGGKHNDLENVGYTARHHTFFEMLGNFSFGDYFKEDAISMAWECVTKHFGLPKDRLLVTVYADDTEARDLWKKIASLPDDRIIGIPTTDNFWAMGDTGPCGPCSEIFYDHGDHIPGGPPGSDDADGDRFVEIWNLVFMQYEQLSPTGGPDGGPERILLPKPSIDTGMGLERITTVIQGVHNNYDIDLFQHIIRDSQNRTHTEGRQDLIASHRVISDHLRASCFLLADGVMPSNEGRGYVLRRIMRRAMRHVHKLGYRDALMWQLVPSLMDVMADAYPELRRAEALIISTLRMEEERFKTTLDRGMGVLLDAVKHLQPGQYLSGDVVFKLYDTYGFPLDLTQDILKSENLSVDVDGFNHALDIQRQSARASWAGSGEERQDTLWFDLKSRLGPSEFLGYQATKADGQITAIIKDGQSVDKAHSGDHVAIITNQTPFYGESGGQMGDSGFMAHAKANITVSDTQKKVGAIHAHMAQISDGDIAVGDDVTLQVDASRRNRLRANHSATHLLHEALRRHLGDHITQKGSLVAPDKLRFDFSHPHPVKPDELLAIEKMVNDEIRENSPVDTAIMTPDEAIQKGAMALFGEKYGDEVRVVSMGQSADQPSLSKTIFSLELCGGTHVKRTGDIGFFKITAEMGVSAGVRRIEAVTGIDAEQNSRDADDLLNNVADALKSPRHGILERIYALQESVKKLNRDLQHLKVVAMQKISDDQKDQANSKTIPLPTGGIIIIRKVNDATVQDLRSLADALLNDLSSGIVLLMGVQNDKIGLVAAMTSDQTSHYNAVDIIRFVSELLGGRGGGGRHDFAQGGGTRPEAIPEVFDAINDYIMHRTT